MPRQAVQKKMCIACNKVQPLSEFYPNRAWAAQQCCDIYCRKCAKAMCYDKESLKKYMWENNRLYSDALWEGAIKSAKLSLANHSEYIKSTTTVERKREIENQIIAIRALGMMNLNYYYHFSLNEDSTGNPLPYNPDSLSGAIVNTADGQEIIDDATRYSKEWNGFFTRRELEYLDNYYAKLSETFALDDISMQDYARKVAKASLDADKMFDKYRAGQVTQKAWLDSQSAFDAMSKSSAFSATQRKDKDKSGNLVLAEIIQDLEVHHHARKPEVRFPEDDIDRILKDFAHTEEAIK